MEKKNNSGGGGFNIFVMGIIIGVLATLLLSTKKGRKLLRVIVNEGADRISKWEDVADSLKTQFEEDTLDEEPIIGEQVGQVKKIEKIEIDSFIDEDVQDEPLHSEMPEENEIRSKVDLKKKAEIKIEEAEPALKKKSRLFKGIHKKSA